MGVGEDMPRFWVMVSRILAFHLECEQIGTDLLSLMRNPRAFSSSPYAAPSRTAFAGCVSISLPARFLRRRHVDS